jgi:hypothetical protein
VAHLGRLRAVTEQPRTHEIAARFWGASRLRFIDAGYRRPSVDEAQLMRLMAGARHALGNAAFESAEAAGRALELKAAMQELRQWLRCDA